MKRFLLGLLVIIVLALIGLRVALPGIIKREANKSLASAEGYQGEVQGVGLSLLRGRIALEDLTLRDTTKGDMRLEIPKFLLTVSWGALIHKEFVADIAIVDPTIRMVAPKPATAAKKTGQKAEKAQKNVEQKTGKPIGEELASLMPFKVKRFELVHGTILIVPGATTAKGEEKKPKAEQLPAQPFKIEDVRILVEDLTNEPDQGPARGTASARLAGGTFGLKIAIHPLEKTPTFDMSTELKNIDLAELGPLIRWQWDVDISSGEFDLVSEVKAADGRFDGYVKPFISGLKAAPGKGAGPIKKLKEAAVTAVNKVLENKKTKQVATKVPFSGTFGSAKTSVWDAVVEVLRNAFIKALAPSFDKLAPPA